MVAAASPSPAPATHSATGRPHPTYTEMIAHALTEVGGGAAATRGAIAKYILGSYSGLPVSHNALLSAHLRRLVAEGVLRTDGADSSSYLFAPPLSEETRDASTPAVGEKRGRGRPRKSPQCSSEMAALSAHTGAATPSVLPAKRKQPAGSVLTEDDHSVTKRGPGRPSKDKTREATEPVQAGGETTLPVQEAVGGKKARIFQNGGDATPLPSEGASSTGVKRGRGRPRKDKPSEPAAMSPTAGSVAAASRRFKRGCGRPSMQKPSAATSPEAMSAETSMEKIAAAAAIYAGTRGDDAAASTGTKPGGGPSRMEKLAAALAAMSAKKGHGTPRKENPAVPAGVKRSRGRPRKDQFRTGLVEAAESFRDMMTEASTRRKEEDLVSGEKTQTEFVAPSDRKETRAAYDGCVPVSGENATSGPVGAADSDLGPVDLADDAVSTGVKRGRGRPRKNKPPAARSLETGEAVSAGIKRARDRPRKNKPAAAAIPAEAGDAASAGIEARGGTPTMDESSEEARSLETGDATSTGIKRPRGRPRKYPAAAMSSKTRDAASTRVKRGRGRPRKKKLAPPAEGKRGRGRPWKV